jgi:hypothetical protein
MFKAAVISCIAIISCENAAIQPTPVHAIAEQMPIVLLTNVVPGHVVPTTAALIPALAVASPTRIVPKAVVLEPSATNTTLLPMVIAELPLQQLNVRRPAALPTIAKPNPAAAKSTAITLRKNAPMPLDSAQAVAKVTLIVWQANAETGRCATTVVAGLNSRRTEEQKVLKTGTSLESFQTGPNAAPYVRLTALAPIVSALSFFLVATVVETMNVLFTLFSGFAGIVRITGRLRSSIKSCTEKTCSTSINTVGLMTGLRQRL